jgi:hypothetical protein
MIITGNPVTTCLNLLDAPNMAWSILAFSAFSFHSNARASVSSVHTGDLLGLASVMSAHVVVDALEPGIPATLSRLALHGLLREKMSYRGLIVSDDMEMKAVARHFQPEQAAIMGINAGIDHFLICHSEEVVDAYLVAIEGGLSRGECPISTLMCCFYKPSLLGWQAFCSAMG